MRFSLCPISVFSGLESAHKQDLKQFAGFHVAIFAQCVHTMGQAVSDLYVLY